MNNIASISILEKFLSHAFFLFFIMQILSPFLWGRTIYFEIIIAASNPYFMSWIFQQKTGKKLLILALGAILIACLGHIDTTLKFIMISISVGYLYYAKEKDIFYLDYYLMVSIIIGILQFIFIFIDIDLARAIGPENIAQSIWGSYATATNTNFYTIFYMPRISGLSREAGFFASLLVCAAFLYYLENRRNHVKKRTIKKIMIFIAYVLSFSKMSMTIIFVFVLEKMKKWINFIPVWAGIIGFLITMIVILYSNTEFIFSDQNITFFHRFAAYLCLFDLDIYSLLFGIESAGELENYISKISVYLGYEKMAGLGGFILHNGFLVTIISFLVLYYLGVNTVGFLLLFLLTINVQIDTNQNFVVLSYFIVFKYFSVKRNFIIDKNWGGINENIY